MVAFFAGRPELWPHASPSPSQTPSRWPHLSTNSGSASTTPSRAMALRHQPYRLAYGERLRWARSPAAAREHLAVALEGVEKLRAKPWTARTQNELRATGIHRRSSPAAHPDELTAPATGDRRTRRSRSKPTRRSVAGCSSPPAQSATTAPNPPQLGVTSRAALCDALPDHKPPVDRPEPDT